MAVVNAAESVAVAVGIAVLEQENASGLRLQLPQEMEKKELGPEVGEQVQRLLLQLSGLPPSPPHAQRVTSAIPSPSTSYRARCNNILLDNIVTSPSLLQTWIERLVVRHLPPLLPKESLFTKGTVPTCSVPRPISLAQFCLQEGATRTEGSTLLSQNVSLIERSLSTSCT